MKGRHRISGGGHFISAQIIAMSLPMTPEEIVSELDKNIVGQDAAKRAVAIALRAT